MSTGSDVPGRITRIPGGVALNIAMTLRRFDMSPEVLTSIGRDAEGDELVAAITRLGVGTRFAYRSDDLPTDRYMAIEGANGVIAAIADAHSLEAAGAKILVPLENGELGSAAKPFEGLIALDGNLTQALLSDIADSPLFSKADIRLAPASPGKAERLRPLIGRENTTFYVNCEEAGLICHRTFEDSRDAARALCDLGVSRALVTNGGQAAAMADSNQLIQAQPPEVLVTRVTGAGDTFMAAHIASQAQGYDEGDALESALRAAAAFVSGDTPI